MLTFSTNSVWSTAVCGRARTKGYWRSAVLLGGVLAGGMTIGQAWAAGDDPRSTSIALNRGGTLLFVANREADSLTVFAVGPPGPNVLTKLAEVPVGEEPVCVASDGLRAFVVNAVSGTVSVVELIGVGVFGKTVDIPVGTEPRGCALSGTRLFVTNFTEGTVSVIDTNSKKVVDTVPVGGNPYGITVVGNDVFVTQFFARLIDGGPGEGFDDGKEGVVQHFLRNNFNLDEITLAPLDEFRVHCESHTAVPNIRLNPPALRR